MILEKKFTHSRTHADADNRAGRQRERDKEKEEKVTREEKKREGGKREGGEGEQRDPEETVWPRLQGGLGFARPGQRGLVLSPERAAAQREGAQRGDAASFLSLSLSLKKT